MAALSLLVSGVPTIVFNCIHTGSWAGIPALQAEYPDWQIQLHSPFWGIVGNTFSIPVQNLLPPFFPWQHAWNHAMDAFLKTPFGAHFKSFEYFGTVSPGISESSAGIGVAIVLMTLISLGAARKFKSGPPVKRPLRQLGLRVVPWILLVMFMAKAGTAQNARQLAAYYIFFFPVLLAHAGHEQLVRQRWWQVLALLSIASSAGLLLVNTSRPLFPAVTLTQHLAAAHPQSKLFTSLHDAYQASGSLKNAEREIQEKLPPHEPLLGYAGVGNVQDPLDPPRPQTQLEPALWQPLGSRRIERVLKTDSPESLLQRGIHYVVIEKFPSMDRPSINDWAARYHASLIAELSFQDRGRDSKQSHVYLMHLEEK
jgi:hypothetical protein